MILGRIAAPLSLALLAGCGAASGIVASGIAASGKWAGSFAVQSATGTVDIPFQLVKPEGDGPFPAIVMMHDCSGLGRHASGAPLRWARKLLAQGYVVIVPDSFAPRGFPDGVCTNERAQTANAYVRAGDARAALAYLRGLAYVDGAPIGLMGGGHGGSTTLAALSDPRAPFAAAIALDPDCGASYGQLRASRSTGPDGRPQSFAGTYEPAAPLLILIGEGDDRTPASDCQKLAAAAQQAAYPVALKTYPGVLPGGRGAATGGDPEALADAGKQVTAFFGRYLKNAE
jgi:dienelactone hydrolase